MAQSKANLDGAIRLDYLKEIEEFVKEHYEADILPISPSEFAVPVVDAEGNEKFVLIKVSVPRGTRNGDGTYDPYDGYGLSEQYVAESTDKQAQKEATQARKQAEAEERKRKREAKKTLAELKKKGLKGMIHEGEGA